MNHKIIITIINIFILVLLVLGVYLPMISIELETALRTNITNLDHKIIDSTRSILGTAWDLYKDDRFIVAIMIFVFSVIVPIIKSVLFLTCLHASSESKHKITKILNIISKWSMADVFVVAIMLVFLATNGAGESTVSNPKILGMTIQVEMSATMTTQLMAGFYFFLAYCITSLATYQFWKLKYDK